MWFIASTVWAVGFNKLDGQVDYQIRKFINETEVIQCITDINNNAYNIIRDDYAQAAVAAVSNFDGRL